MDRGAPTDAVAAASTSSSRPRKGARDTPAPLPAPIASPPVTLTGAAADVAPRAVEAAVRETIHRETEVVLAASASDAGGMSVSLLSSKLLTAFEVADPRMTPATKKAESERLTVAESLDRYVTNYVEAEGLQDPVTIKGRLKAINAVIGNEPAKALEKAEPIQRFKAAYREGRAVATVNRALSTLRAAVNWGRFQDPPLLTTSPFHRFGVSIRAKEETKRDRRVGPGEEGRSRRTREAHGDRPPLARSARGCLPATGRRRRHPHDPVDARACRHQADAAVPEHHGRGTQARDERRVGAQTPVAARGWLESSRACRRRQGRRRMVHAESTMAGHIESRRIVSQFSRPISPCPRVVLR
jgi:hypothetical protein